jgi:hypothetical protein
MVGWDCDWGLWGGGRRTVRSFCFYKQHHHTGQRQKEMQIVKRGKLLEMALNLKTDNIIHHRSAAQRTREREQKIDMGPYLSFRAVAFHTNNSPKRSRSYPGLFFFFLARKTRIEPDIS